MSLAQIDELIRRHSDGRLAGTPDYRFGLG